MLVSLPCGPKTCRKDKTAMHYTKRRRTHIGLKVVRDGDVLLAAHLDLLARGGGQRVAAGLLALLLGALRLGQ